MSTPLRNWEIVLYSLHLEGGASRRVHTEDVALRCFALASDAFSWLKHAEYPDKEVVRKDLIRLRMGQYGQVFTAGRAGKVKGNESGKSIDGWTLTQEGVRWIVDNETRLSVQLGQRTRRFDRQEIVRALDRVRRSDLFQSFAADPNSFSPQIGKLAELLRCRVDAEEEVWSSRFATLRNQAELVEDGDLLAFIERCEQLRPALT